MRDLAGGSQSQSLHSSFARALSGFSFVRSAAYNFAAVASVASQGRFPVATGLSLCLYLNCAPEAGKESSGSLGLFLAFAAGVAAVPPPSPDVKLRRTSSTQARTGGAAVAQRLAGGS